MDLLIDLEFMPFSSFQSGIVYEIIKNSYALFPSLSSREKEWLLLDSEIFSNTTFYDLQGFIAALDGEPVGFICWQIEDNGENARLLECSIVVAHQKKGYGGAMLEEAIRRLALAGVKSIKAKTNERLIASCRLFDKYNFSFVSLSRDVDLSEGLGFCVNYLHIVGKKLARPKKQRKKWKIF